MNTEDYLNSYENYRIVLPVEDFLTRDVHVERVNLFLSLIHRKYEEFRIILRITENGPFLYFSTKNPEILKTVYYKINEDHITREFFRLNYPIKGIYSSRFYKKSLPVGLEIKTDFIRHLLSYMNRTKNGEIFIVCILKPTFSTIFLNKEGEIFKFNIKVLFFGDVDENILRIIESYWSNDKNRLYFKRIRERSLKKTKYVFASKKEILNTLPFPDQYLMDLGIASRFAKRELRIKNNIDINLGRGIKSGNIMKFSINLNEGQSFLLIGETGSGKSSTLVHTVIGLLENPILVLDPTGDTVKKIINAIDDETLKRVIYISPYNSQVSMNILSIPENGERDILVPRLSEDIIQILKNVTEAESGVVGGLVGSRISEIIRNSVNGLVEIPGSTLLDVYDIISRPEKRYRLKELSKNKEFKNFLEDIENYPVEDLSSTRRTLSFLKTNTILKNMLCSDRPKLNLRDAIDKKKIVLVNGERGRVGERISTFLLSSILSMYWIGVESRERKDPVFVFCDEFQDYMNSSFEDMLILGRKENLNLFMATTHLSGLSKNVFNAIMANTKNFVLFKLSPYDAKEFSEKFSVSTDDLVNLPFGLGYVRNSEHGEISKIYLNIQNLGNKIEKAIENSRIYCNQDTKIDYEKMNLSFDILLLKTMKLKINKDNLMDIRRKTDEDLDNFENVDDEYLKQYLDDIRFKIIEKLAGMGFIVRFISIEPFILFLIPYLGFSYKISHNHSMKFFLDPERVENDKCICVFTKLKMDCSNCYSIDEFFGIMDDNIEEKIFSILLKSKKNVFRTTAYRIAENIRRIYGDSTPDLEKEVRRILIEKGIGKDGERVTIDNKKIRTIEVDVTNLREKYEECKEDLYVDLEIED